MSLFSGIEAATVAWEPLGWEPVAFAEVDAFPSAVLAERFPDVPNLGDVTKIDWNEVLEEHGAVDVVVGGSPCQSFSIAGNRDGLAGASGLMWEYVRAISEIRPRWLVWENVPGALSSGPGKGKGKQVGEDFGCLLRALDELGYGLCWRVLDAQFFGVAQRRRRVFLVGRLGAEPPVEVLFEPDGLRWDFESGAEKREGLARAAGIDAGTDRIGGVDDESCLTPWDYQYYRVHGEEGASPALNAHATGGAQSPNVLVLKTHHIEQNGKNHEVEVSPTLDVAGAPHAVCIQGSMIGRGDKNGPQGSGINDEVAFTLNTADRHAVCFQQNQRDEVRLIGGEGDVAGAINANSGMKNTNYVCQTNYGDDLAGTLTQRHDSSAGFQQGQNIVCMTDTQAHSSTDDEVCGTLSARMFKDPPSWGTRRRGNDLE